MATVTKMTLRVNNRKVPFTFAGKPTAEYIEKVRAATARAEREARKNPPTPRPVEYEDESYYWRGLSFGGDE